MLKFLSSVSKYIGKCSYLRKPLGLVHMKAIVFVHDIVLPSLPRPPQKNDLWCMNQMWTKFIQPWITLNNNLCKCAHYPFSIKYILFLHWTFSFKQTFTGIYNLGYWLTDSASIYRWYSFSSRLYKLLESGKWNQNIWRKVTFS